MPQVIRFEIYAEEPRRALEFYARIFACSERLESEPEWRIPGVGRVSCRLDGDGQLYGLLLKEGAAQREGPGWS